MVKDKTVGAAAIREANKNNTVVKTEVKRKFTDMFFDNFIRTTLGMTVLIAAYMLSAKFGIELYVVGGLAASAVIALILTVIEVIRKKRVARA